MFEKITSKVMWLFSIVHKCEEGGLASERVRRWAHNSVRSSVYVGLFALLVRTYVGVGCCVAARTNVARAHVTLVGRYYYYLLHSLDNVSLTWFKIN